MKKTRPMNGKRLMAYIAEHQPVSLTTVIKDFRSDRTAVLRTILRLKKSGLANVYFTDYEVKHITDSDKVPVLSVSDNMDKQDVEWDLHAARGKWLVQYMKKSRETLITKQIHLKFGLGLEAAKMAVNRAKKFKGERLYIHKWVTPGRSNGIAPGYRYTSDPNQPDEPRGVCSEEILDKHRLTKPKPFKLPKTKQYWHSPISALVKTSTNEART